MDALLERVQVLVPHVSPEATDRTVRMLRQLHADALEAHAVLQRARLRSQADGSTAEDESDLGEAIAELAFDDPDDAGESGDELCKGCSEEEEPESDSSDDSQPPSPETRDRRARRVYDRQRLKATAAQRARGVPSLVSHSVPCASCRNGGEIAEGNCLAAKMLEEDNPETVDIREVITTDMPMIEGLECDGDREVACRSSRHALYKRFIAWKFADPLGAGKRKRLPDCCVWQIRFLFPDPRCGEDCDLLRGCERKGHYVGFRSAAESRAARNGETLIDLEYHD